MTMSEITEHRLGVSPGIPMRPCPDCNYPAAYDAFGNTDHVCLNGPGAELWNAVVPMTTAGPTTVIIESTADGHDNWMFQRWASEQDGLDGPASEDNYHA